MSAWLGSRETLRALFNGNGNLFWFSSIVALEFYLESDSTCA